MSKKIFNWKKYSIWNQNMFFWRFLEEKIGLPLKNLIKF
jgi:hypothetical protein